MNKDKFLSFEDAKDFVRGLKLKNLKDWQNYKKPVFIPSTPNRTYSDNWISWSDWLGTNNISQRDRKFLSFKEAKEFIQPLKFPSSKEYKKYHKINGIKNIPVNPDTNVEYINSGWISWNDFLGNDFTATNKREYLSYNEAKIIIHTLGVNSIVEYKEKYKSGDIPKNIPANPEQTYKDKGWISSKDFLGYTKINNYEKNKNFLSFNDARNFVHELELKTQKEWNNYCYSTDKPNNIPANPDKTYKNEWVSIGDWIGIGNKNSKNRDWLPYEEAKEVILNKEFQSISNWSEWCKSGDKPSNIPSHPQKIYKDKGWTYWGDWLGTNRIATYNLEYLSYEEAKKFIKSLNIKSKTEWEEYCKSGKKPDNIPYDPVAVYGR